MMTNTRKPVFTFNAGNTCELGFVISMVRLRVLHIFCPSRLPEIGQPVVCSNPIDMVNIISGEMPMNKIPRKSMRSMGYSIPNGDDHIPRVVYPAKLFAKSPIRFADELTRFGVISSMKRSYRSIKNHISSCCGYGIVPPFYKRIADYE